MNAPSGGTPHTSHLVHAGDLAYAAMGQGSLLVPVRVERIVSNDAIGTDQKHLRVTVYVTGTREPFRRGERLYELPASYIVARKATGIRTKFGGRIVLGRTIVVSPDAIRRAGK